MKIYGKDFFVKGFETRGDFSLNEISNNGGVKEIGFSCQYNEAIKANPIQITFYLPALNILTAYAQTVGQARLSRSFKPEWNPFVVSSRLSSGSPTVSLIDYEEKNVYTISVSDVINPIEIKVGLVEEDASCRVDIFLFSSESKILKNYQIKIRIDERKIPYHQSLWDAEKYLFEENRLKPCYVPEAAKLPVYSTWYSYHQNLTDEKLIEECLIAKQMGMETIIVDDGWQTNDIQRGYTYCGDWEIEPTKFPNVKKFVETVHQIGMKVVFWFSLPFLGKNAECYKEFSSMVLDDPNQPFCVLDPRYPKVRNYLIGKYVRAVQEWGLDGLKLDFIDSFKITKYSSEKNENMDYDNLYDAINSMMLTIRNTLQQINPEIMLEFRQTYIGPVMQTYGNMFRVGDCPCDSLTNRVSAIDMRLNMHSVVVHSDMIMWNYEDSVESASKQLLSIFFTVPQISVRLNKIPACHRQMLKHYLSVWLEHRDVLLDGSFKAYGIDGTYTYLEMQNEEKAFFLDFGKNNCKIISKKKNIYLNLTATREVYFDCGITRKTFIVYDVLGNELEKIDADGLLKINVPHSGMVIIMENGERI